ncbi:glycosyltransferase family 39 protein [Actinokineospora iranica]|uniref:Dolichyl-phosphate-mannose-protein mannosyltransferase n=1 Tax=Actinokineospora iranica TaxID=1271860 RepID=A0A1G6KE37_9PSEU|nr:glycosyltransferase family 39 protein [Actinokineospora iranica]SDC29349.1 Dolichyl-phosphate-mannose-protein mannosyltransferase [Actinokineospora iranica]
MSAHHVSADFPAPRVWHAAEAGARALPAAALAAVTALLRLAAGDTPTQVGEGRHLAQVFAVDALDRMLDPFVSSLAWLQIAAYTTATDAFIRHATALSAVREPMVIAAATTGALLWLLARRMGLARWTAAAAVAITALSPLALNLQLAVRPENVAVPWALAALALLWTPHRHRRITPDLWATVFLVVAVLTAPVTLALVGTAALLVWRRGRRRLSLMLAALFSLGTGIGLGAGAAVTAFRVASYGPGPGEWLRLDPLLGAAAAAAALGALLSYRLRPLALGVLTLVVLSVLPGGPDTGALAVVVAPAALLVAAVVERGLTHGGRAGKHTRTRPLLAPTAAVALTALAFAVPAWVSGLRAAVDSHTDPVVAAAATRWLSENLPTTPVVTDSATWAELVRGGRLPQVVLLPDTCTRTCATRSWLLVTPTLRTALPYLTPLAEAAEHAETIAVFGSGPDLVEVLRPPDAQDVPLLTAAPEPPAPPTSHRLPSHRIDPGVLSTLAVLPCGRPVLSVPANQSETVIIADDPVIGPLDQPGQAILHPVGFPTG